MRRLYLQLIMIFLVLLVGCRGGRVSSQSGGTGGASAQADLPPPGHPVVGGNPPMPTPVNRPTLSRYKVETVASGLVTPWDMAFTPDGRIYATERPGRVRLIVNGRMLSQPYATIANVTSAINEGGLMGIALHPKYPNPRWVYVMYTYRSGGQVFNRVSRFTDTGSGLAGETAVITRIPGGAIHNGGIIRFGPDGMLYIGTGETHRSELAQNLSSLGGKILRVTPEGKIPSDNPFPKSPVYAYGFRNVQGLAWNTNGDLWATNHGPTGEFGLLAKDSVFIVQKGGNHGWPRSLGVTNIKGVVPPVIFSPNTAIAPAGALFYNGNLMPELKGNFFFATLRGEHLQRVVLSVPRKISGIERWFQTGTQQGIYGRLRAVGQGRDGAIYFSTSNRSRGAPASGDDHIYRIVPK